MIIYSIAYFWHCISTNFLIFQLNCLVRNKAIKLTPEEAVRQLYLRVLIDDYEYPVDRIALEYAFYSVVIWHLENSKHKGESYTLNSEMVTFIKRKYYDNIWND
ncbi:MAG: type I restriction enzyme HsdR N-terminal domain-containing protein [Ekhidna sp.]|nr:type I restriction enzyme HsdR N-terminal domain-containing protein [Ekhidna sp.]